jgi:hypothetical protein
VTVDPTNAQRIVIATGVMLGTSNVDYFPVGIMVSENGGVTWSALDDSGVDEPITRLSIEDNWAFALIGERVLTYRLN